jgi:hypothetical protein
MAVRLDADGRWRAFSHIPNVHGVTLTSAAASAFVKPSLSRRVRSCAGSRSPCSQRNSGLLARNATGTPGTKKATLPRRFCCCAPPAEQSPRARKHGKSLGPAFAGMSGIEYGPYASLISRRRSWRNSSAVIGVG